MKPERNGLVRILMLPIARLPQKHEQGGQHDADEQNCPQRRCDIPFHRYEDTTESDVCEFIYSLRRQA